MCVHMKKQTKKRSTRVQADMWNKVHLNVMNNTEPSVFLIAPEGIFCFQIHTLKEAETGRD